MKTLILAFACIFLSLHTASAQPQDSPSFTQQPSSRSVCPGGNTSFDAAIANPSGCTVGFQWQHRAQANANAEQGWADITDQITGHPAYRVFTSASSKVNGASAGHNGYQYRLKISCGTSFTLSSAAATLSVSPLAITAHPADKVVCPGGNTSFGVAVNNVGCGSSYAWFWRATPNDLNPDEQAPEIGWRPVSELNTASSSPYSGGNTDTLSVSNAPAAHDRYQFRCLITAGSGALLKSNPAVLFAGPGIRYYQAGRVTPCIFSTQPATFEFSLRKLSCGAPPVDYNYTRQWQEKRPDGDWVNIVSGTDGHTVTNEASGAEHAFSRLSISNPLNHENSLYRCKVSLPGNPGAEFFTRESLLTMSPEITGLSAPVCSGSSVVLDIYNRDRLVNGFWQGCQYGGYQWQRAAPVAAGVALTWVDITRNTRTIGSETSPSYALSDQYRQPRVSLYATLTISNIPASHNGYQYRCKINRPDMAEKYSEVRIITVIQAPALTAPSDQTVCAGSNLSFSVVASPANACSLNYQWQSRASATADWAEVGNAAPYSGATGPDLRVTNVTADYNGRQYRCLLKRDGAIVVEGEPANLTVNSPALTPLSNQTVCLGDRAVFSIPVSNRPCISSYKWQYRANAEAAWADVNMTPPSAYSAGEENSTFSLTISSSAVAHRGQYRCLFTAASGEMSSNEATLTVNEGTIGNPVAQSVCPGDNAEFTVSVTNASCLTAPAWEYRTSSSGEWGSLPTSGTQIIPSAEGVTLRLTNVPLGYHGYQYRYTATSHGRVIESEPAMLNVSQPVITATPTGTICPGTSVSVAVSWGTASCTVDYQWQYLERGKTAETDWANVVNSTVPGEGYSGAASATLSINRTPAAYNGYQYRCKFTKNDADLGTSSSVTLSVHPAPAIRAQPSAQRLCAGVAARFTVLAGEPSCITAYQWQHL